MILYNLYGTRDCKEWLITSHIGSKGLLAKFEEVAKDSGYMALRTEEVDYETMEVPMALYCKDCGE